MTRYIGCETARELLDAFVDGELSVADQVMVESHLRWCSTCSARVEDMGLIGDSLRASAPLVHADGDDERALSALQAEVLTRIGTERRDLLTARLRELCSDSRLLWPILGATFALFVCVSAATGVLRAASAEQPESLAAMIAAMADPGSDLNPLRVDGSVAIPRTIGPGPMLDVAEDEAAYTVAMVVTREGRISNYELLLADRVVPTSHHGRVAHAREVAALLDAVKQARFAPAQRLTGRTVAVNMVWLFARTTVKGSMHDEVNAVVRTPPRRKPEEPKPALAEPPVDAPAAPVLSTTV